MKIFESAGIPWEAADGANFVGRARVKRADASDATGPLKLFRVEFEASARTNWHAHSGPQLLLVVEGRCRAQAWGEPAREAGPGDAIYIAPEEKHWHGATPEGRMTHIALTLAPKTRWLEPVSDEQYSAVVPVASQRATSRS